MDFGRKDDSLFWDILTALALSVNMRLQWREIRDIVHKKYEGTYDKETFEVIFSRVLKRLFQEGYVKKDTVGHQEVYYFIPKQRQQEIVDELNKRFAHKKLDEIWERLSSEQRKKAVETIVFQSNLIIQSQKAMAMNLTSFIEDWIPELVSRVNKAPEMPREYSPEEKRELLKEIGSLQEQIAEIETNETHENDFWKKKWEQMIELGLEFTNKVVDPLYNGRFNEAIEDLMRKAIAEQNRKLDK